MKKHINMEIGTKNGGFELLRKGVTASVIRQYWTGSPWRALRDCVRGM